MLNVHFVIVGAVVGGVGTVAYLRDTLRGVTQPNRVTWLLWAAAPLLAFAVELHEGVGLRALMTFTVGFGPLLVFLVSFRSRGAVWQIGWLEYLCGFLSIVGLAVWIVTRHGTVALVASITADALAALPTLRKSLWHPETETASAYVCAGLNAALTLLTVKQVTTGVVAFPAYILLVATIESVLILGRVGPRLQASRYHPFHAAASSKPSIRPGPPVSRSM